jgi:GTPase
MRHLVAIVGRPNVGKSTLFNRLTESRHAIVESVSGVTRDRHYGQVEWQGKTFAVVDTGGYIKNSSDIFEQEIKKQVELAIDEAEVILFAVDVTTGITDLDQAVAALLRKRGKSVIVVANKVDDAQKQMQIAEFYGFGFDSLFGISAISGSGTGDLLDHVLTLLPADVQNEDLSNIPRLAVVGKPNVGKSSIINTFLGHDRNIVTSLAGTTRDAIETRYKGFGFDFILVDTAGIRKKSKVEEDIEFYSVLRSFRAIDNSDVCLFMIDATEGVQKQDLNIFYKIIESRCGVVVVINKWDLVEKDHKTLDAYKADLLEKLAPFNDVPVVFTSVTEKQRIHKALEIAMEVYHSKTQHIPTSELNKVMLEEIEKCPPPMYKGKIVNIKYIQQVPTHNMAFAFYCNSPQYVKENYKRFLENKMRHHFKLTGVPFSLFFRTK